MRLTRNNMNDELERYGDNDSEEEFEKRVLGKEPKNKKNVAPSPLKT